MNPKSLAIDFIKAYVLRGDSLKSLLDGQGGQFCSEYGVQFGGYIYSGEKLIYKGKRDEIVVSRLDGKDCLFIFKAQTLYDEVRSGQQMLF